MPDPTLSAAIKEAYASAPTDQVIYHTLEIWHPVFGTPIRVVRDYTSIDAMIEATAARDASTIVTFTGYAFDIVPPDLSTAALPQCTITIDNVSREILAQIDQAVLSTGVVTVIYRAYLSDNLAIGPENLPPLAMTATMISADPLKITATVGFANLLDLSFPGLDYELTTFTGLQE